MLQWFVVCVKWLNKQNQKASITIAQDHLIKLPESLASWKQNIKKLELDQDYNWITLSDIFYIWWHYVYVTYFWQYHIRLKKTKHFIFIFFNIYTICNHLCNHLLKPWVYYCSSLCEEQKRNYRRNSASILLNTSVVKHFFYYVNVSNVP